MYQNPSSAMCPHPSHALDSPQSSACHICSLVIGILSKTLKLVWWGMRPKPFHTALLGAILHEWCHMERLKALRIHEFKNDTGVTHAPMPHVRALNVGEGIIE